MTTATLDGDARFMEHLQRRLIVAGLAGAVALTVGWWALLARGLWLAIG